MIDERAGRPVVHALPVERITVKRGDLEEIVLPRLLGTVFHVTSPGGFEGITVSAMIRSNQDGKLAFTFPQSQNNYGRQHGWVCLFDLRNVREDELRDALMKFNFLKPTKHDPVFLFLNPSDYGKLIAWTVAPPAVMLIPHVETWYPSDLPVSALAGALAVTVEPDDVDSAFRSLMRGLRRDKEQILSTSPTIESRTLEELKKRTDEWVSVALEGGLQVDGWDEGRVQAGAAGYRITVHGERPPDSYEPERCPECRAELHTHTITWERILVRGRPFVPAMLDCMTCGYSRLVLDPADSNADAPLLQQLTPEEWNAAYGRLMEVFRKGFESEERFLSAYRHLYGDDDRLLRAWRHLHG